MMYKYPKTCPHCGRRDTLQEQYNILTTGIPMNRSGSIRFRLISTTIRFKVEYRCGHCDFIGKYDDRKDTWKVIRTP